VLWGKNEGIQYHKSTGKNCDLLGTQVLLKSLKTRAVKPSRETTVFEKKSRIRHIIESLSLVSLSAILLFKNSLK
jgi:hypothetical protein